MIGELERAREHYRRMKEQAQREDNPAYLKAAELALSRLVSPA